MLNSQTKICLSKRWHHVRMQNSQTEKCVDKRWHLVWMQNSLIKKCVGNWLYQLNKSLEAMRHTIRGSDRGHRVFQDAFECM
jgi:hypothetical protein